MNGYADQKPKRRSLEARDQGETLRLRKYVRSGKKGEVLEGEWGKGTKGRKERAQGRGRGVVLSLSQQLVWPLGSCYVSHSHTAFSRYMHPEQNGLTGTGRESSFRKASRENGSGPASVLRKGCS